MFTEFQEEHLIKLKTRILLLSLFIFSHITNAQHTHDGLHHWEIPSKDPDRIILTFNGDPSKSRAVTWRTNSEIKTGIAQIAESKVNSFFKGIRSFNAVTESFDLGRYKGNKSLKVNYHSVVFKDLEPDKLYVYRVGDGIDYWSEWIQFKTAKEEYSPFEFVYFGDAQNNVLSDWSRVIRMAYKTAPSASFAVHAGDLINLAHKDHEWAEWFKAGSFIHSHWTSIPVLGNHEFKPLVSNGTQEVSIQWRPQFNLPVENNLSKKLHETVYTVDYQDVRVIVLNSNFNLNEQTSYLEEKLSSSTAKWNIVTCHHSIFSPAAGRDFKYGRKKWKPLFDKYNVDLVLNGHDHTYARGHVPKKITTEQKNNKINTIYVTSVSGPKLYPLDREQIKTYINDDGYEPNRFAGQTQFFQVISIKNDSLIYKAYTAKGDLYDKAIIIKNHSTGEKILK